MRELHLIEEESTPTFYVLRDVDGVRYQLARAEVHVGGTGSAEPAGQSGSTVTSLSAYGGFTGPETTGATEDLGFAPDHVDQEPLDVEIVEAEVVEEHAEPEPPARPGDDTPTFRAMARERPLPEPDPLFSTPLSMRPKEIQARIRAGATAEELADEMGVAVSRLEAYAHPVLLERIQVADAAKQSHPVREDGTAKLTLFEILATAFAARGHSVSDATWDATREPGDDWVVHVTWQAGLSENEALWSFRRTMGAPATTEARNAVAADLTDPDFVQPVRSLTAVNTRPGRGRGDEPGAEAVPEAGAEQAEEYAEGDFLQHPDAESQPQKRTRRAVTPHWEDVLLGVRTNTKRPRK
ncbi:septation protein SepH [Corynebacterium sp. UBA2622]|uniref:septation protein SepH n=1 Tax=Corynebacterium sp. UBA2622 TaxID=1946393 RepID=UPI0025BFB778|nr:septation protein SepH [Corynebacterium sp. UBA2622]